MNHSTKETDKFRKDHIKLALIPALLLVLAAILFWPESAPEVNAEVPRLRTTPVKSIREDNSPPPTATSQLDQQWASPDLLEVTAVNPFAKSRPIQAMLGELPKDEPTLDREAPAPEDDGQTAGGETSEQSGPPSDLPAEAPDEPERKVIDVTTIATLQAIIDGARGRSALINSRIFRVGDLLKDEYRIIEISPTAVFVEWIEPKKNDESI